MHVEKDGIILMKCDLKIYALFYQEGFTIYVTQLICFCVITLWIRDSGFTLKAARIVR